MTARAVHESTDLTAASPIRPGTRCQVCRHPDAAIINRALALRTMGPREIGRRFSVDHGSVSRHAARHLLPEMRESAGELGEVLSSAVLDEARSLMARVKRRMAAAEEDPGNWPAFKAMAGEMRSVLELVAKLTGELNERPQIQLNILMAAEWPAVASLLFEVAERRPEEAVPLLEARLADWEAGGAGS